MEVEYDEWFHLSALHILWVHLSSMYLEGAFTAFFFERTAIGTKIDSISNDAIFKF